MTYAVPPPAAAAPPAPEPPRRPVTVQLAGALLALMGLAGLIYAIATLVVAPGTVHRFRDATGGPGASPDADGYVTVVWVGAATATVLAIILFALFVVLALGLRRGSNPSRVSTLVFSVLGLLAGAGSLITVLVQQSGPADAATIGGALSAAYPDSWIGLNETAAIAQMVGYLIVGVLVLATPKAFFGRGPAAPVAPPQGFAGLPSYAQGNPYYSPYGGYSAPPASPPQSGPDDEYWSRPS